MPVLHLPDARARYPNAGLVFYHRCSTAGGQSGTKEKGYPKLKERVDSYFAELDEMTDGSLWESPFWGVEYGQFSKPRPVFDAAYQFSRENGCLLVGYSIDRLFKAESYDKQTNYDAIPTPEDWKAFEERTAGVVVASMTHPDTPFFDRHSLATKRTGKAGRRSKAQKEAAWKILTLHTQGQSLRQIAERCGVSKDAVSRLLKTSVPIHLVNGEEGKTLGTIEQPAAIYSVMCEEASRNPSACRRETPK